MKQKVACLFIFSFFIFTVGYSQITKGFWMFGGSGSFRSSDIDVAGQNYKSTVVSIQPKIGIFLIDKLGTGINLDYQYSKNRSEPNFNSPVSTIGIGPFIRYYLLKQEKMVNILLDANLSYNRQIGKNNSNTALMQYGILGGPVLFLNSSVALELLTGYRYAQEIIQNGSRNNEYLIQLGLQIHLEKKRD